MARTSRSGQALIELILSLFLILTFLGIFMRASMAIDRQLQKQRFVTDERLQWSGKRGGP